MDYNKGDSNGLLCGGNEEFIDSLIEGGDMNILVRCNNCDTLHQGKSTDGFQCQKCGYTIGRVVKEDIVLTYTTIMQSIKFGYDNSQVDHDTYLEAMKMFKKVRDAVGSIYLDQDIAYFIEKYYPAIKEMTKEVIEEKCIDYIGFLDGITVDR